MLGSIYLLGKWVDKLYTIQINIQITDHLMIVLLFIIWIPDWSSIQIPTVLIKNQYAQKNILFQTSKGIFLNQFSFSLIFKSKIN